MDLGNICMVVFTGNEATEEHFDETVAKAFDDRFKLTARTFLVRSPMLTYEVAEAVAIKGDRRRFVGAVLRVNPHYYSGFAPNALWDWLAKSEAENR